MPLWNVRVEPMTTWSPLGNLTNWATFIHPLGWFDEGSLSLIRSYVSYNMIWVVSSLGNLKLPYRSSTFVRAYTTLHHASYFQRPGQILLFFLAPYNPNRIATYMLHRLPSTLTIWTIPGNLATCIVVCWPICVAYYVVVFHSSPTQWVIETLNTNWEKNDTPAPQLD